jgi:hypothetical protein
LSQFNLWQKIRSSNLSKVPKSTSPTGKRSSLSIFWSRSLSPVRCPSEPQIQRATVSIVKKNSRAREILMK